MQINTLTTSVVIPVYNEAEGLYACLKAIGQLNKKPLEVIVVDNNSTDNSAEVALSFNWVKLVHEEKQGVVHARSRGFNEASGDIIARIDADTLLKPEWLDRVNELFTEDKSLAAVSGSADYYDFLFIDIANTIDRITRKYMSKRLKRHMFLHGSNMALRTSAWNEVKGSLCSASGIHEDLDLAIHLQDAGFKVEYDEQLVAGISTRRIGSGFKKFVNYTLASPKTYAAHDLKCRVHMYPVIFFIWAIYAPAHLAYLSYNPKTKNFSLRYFMESKLKGTRIDPTINVA